MKHVFALFALAAVLASPSAKAEPTTWCLPGDVQMGPNCIHTVVEHHETDFGDGVVIDQPMTYSTVYRMRGTVKTVVWGADIGEVLRSTAKTLTIKVTMYGSGGGPVEDVVTATWDGTKYK